jgi:D-glucuronyl C5-epimerase-like protein/flagellar hook capping protein FlgD/PASTA domain-containing protein
MRFVWLAALLATAAAVLILTTVAFGSSGDRAAVVPGAASAPGLGAPFVSHSGTCPSSPGYTTFTVPISAEHSDPVAELTANGQATLRDARYDGVDTGGAGAVWEPWGESLSPGEYVNVEVDCNSSTDVSYTFNLYDAPSTPFTVSGAVTNCPTCSPQNDVRFSAPGTAHYVADLTLTQGSVDLSGGPSHQVFGSSGSYDLGYLDRGQRDLYLTPLAGPTAKWSLSIHALPVMLSGLKSDPAQIRPKQITTIGYHVDGDVTLSAAIESSSGTLVRTLASDLAVADGDNTLTWDGLNQARSPVPNGRYTVAVSFTDAAGNSGSGHASVKVEACRVPRVIGRRLAEAKRVIVRAGCSVSTIPRKTASKRLQGHVVSQKPRFGMVLRRGARVRLWVGSEALAGGATADRQSFSGLVFRYYPGSGWQFHPLLSFEHLNNLVSAGQAPAAQRLVEALLARGHRQGAALYWRYDFSYQGGPVPWSSGFVQAVAAQSLARASRLLGRPALLRPAGAALLGLRQGLLLHVGGGLWIREYGFTQQVILNSQLQSLLSLHSYASLVATPQAARLVQSLYRATVRLLPRFDLGCHSLYQLGGPVASHHYQDYHVALLKRLAGEYPDEPLFRRLYLRWRRCA